MRFLAALSPRCRECVNTWRRITSSVAKPLNISNLIGAAPTGSGKTLIAQTLAKIGGKLGAKAGEAIVKRLSLGNVLAGYYARKMGLPINLVVASNKNDILTRFFESGE